MENLSIYLLIGIIWALINEGSYLSNGHRIRTILLWPITFTAFIIGFIEAWKNQNNEKM